MAKEKKYQLIETEPEMVAEPTGVAVATPGKVVPSDHSIPAGVPHTIEKALAEIEEGERQFEHDEVYSHKEVMQMVWGKIGGYAG